jgi:hypothetical protein
MKTRRKIKFEIDKKKLINILKKILPFIAGCFILAFIFVKLLIPLALGLWGMFLLSSLLYSKIIDINFKFVGSIVFLFIAWKIFEAIATIFIKIFKSMIKYMDKK